MYRRGRPRRNSRACPSTTCSRSGGGGGCGSVKDVDDEGAPGAAAGGDGLVRLRLAILLFIATCCSWSALQGKGPFDYRFEIAFIPLYLFIYYLYIIIILLYLACGRTAQSPNITRAANVCKFGLTTASVLSLAPTSAFLL
jgi:hypothetical protein